MAIDAEYTITRPIARSSSVPQASVVSYASMARLSRGSALNDDGRETPAATAPSLGMRGLARMRRDGGLESLSALAIVAKHVEARACRRQQHGVAASRMGNRACDGDFERGRVFDGKRHPGKRRRYRGSVAPDEDHRAAMRCDTALERREVLTF